MSLVELKQHAKERRIKQYYVMKRIQLIQLLSMADLPMSYKLEKKTIHQLRDEAKAKGIRGFWSLHREELLTLLYPAQQQHEDPQQQESPHQANSQQDRGESLQQHGQQGGKNVDVNGSLCFGGGHALNGVADERLDKFAH